MIDVATLEKQALTLSDKDRLDLADRIYASLNGFANDEIERAWTDEIKRRSDEWDKDPSLGIPHEQVMAEARRIIGEARSR